ncbi:MAG TPA: Panacea domain-containing protein [Melioribacteraceae bacterium]|nr:Panacea domain-containing protein [Melioribacteraceae bacterium]
MKVFYFADKLHLSKYGRFMFGETYVAMPKGHVPSTIYDMIKFIRGDGSKEFDPELKKSIIVDGNKIKAIQPANLDYLSPSEIECLNNAIDEFGKLNHSLVFFKSHKDHAYKVTPVNSDIAIDDIVDSLDNKNTIKEYLNNLYE